MIAWSIRRSAFGKQAINFHAISPLAHSPVDLRCEWIEATNDKLLCNLYRRDMTGFCLALGIAETSAKVEGKDFDQRLESRPPSRRLERNLDRG
jgi:hypothetical protein